MIGSIPLCFRCRLRGPRAPPSPNLFGYRAYLFCLPTAMYSSTSCLTPAPPLPPRPPYTRVSVLTQNLETLDPSALTPLTPEVISRQATINIGTIGHVAHGKSTVVKAISGVQVRSILCCIITYDEYSFV